MVVPSSCWSRVVIDAAEKVVTLWALVMKWHGNWLLTESCMGLVTVLAVSML